MGHSNDDSMVRVDFFKPGGKWYTMLAIKWTGAYGQHEKESNPDWWDIHKQLAKSIRDHFGDTPGLNEMDAICLDPYHEHSHPIQIKAGGWNNLK